MATIDFTGQTALVTGAATGLGLATARALGLAGARLVVNDLTPERAAEAARALEAEGIACAGFAADVRDAAAVERLAGDAERAFGGIDIFVANAGLYPNVPFLEMTEGEWDRVIDTNLKGTFLACQAVARRMVAAGRGGRIVTLSSGAANAAFWGWSHYCTSKAGVVMLTKAMALELAPHDIRVNSVLPGYIDVPEGGGHLSEEYRVAARGNNLRGRAATPEDVANAIVLLCSPLADFVDGTTLVVDGGASAGPARMRPVRE